MRKHNHRRTSAFLLSVLTGVCVTACSSPDRPAVELDGDLAFVDVTVIPMDSERALPSMTVVIADGVIQSLTPTAETGLAPGVTVIDGKGRYLMPALADMHVHIWDRHEPQLYVAWGVTTVRNMWGEATTLAMREDILHGRKTGPRMMTAGRIVDGAPKIWPGSDEVSDVETARTVVGRQIDEGFDFIKVYSNLKPPEFDAVVAAAREQGIPFAGHTPTAVGLEAMLGAGPDSIEHLTGWNTAVKRDAVDLGQGFRTPEMIEIGSRIGSGELSLDEVFDPAKRRAMAALSLETGVWNVPTLIVLKQIRLTREQAKAEFDRVDMAYVSAGIRDFWNPDNDFRRQEVSDEQLAAMQVFFEESLAQVKALHDAGAPLLIGSDAPNPFVFHGLSVHEELTLFVEAGVPEYAALRAATAAPAEYFGESGQWGIVAAGARADLVLLSANPLESISNTRKIEGVMQDGRWRDRAELDALLAEAAKAYASSPEWFEGRETLGAEFDVDAGEALAFRMLAGDLEGGAERMAAVRSSDARELVAQGEFKGFIESQYSIRRSLDDTGGVDRSLFRLVDTVPARVVQVVCTPSACELEIDGAQTDILETGSPVFMTQGPSDAGALAARLEALEVGQNVEIETVWLAPGGEPSLDGGTASITRQDNEALAGRSGMIDTRRYALEWETSGSATLWVEADTGLPMRLERSIPGLPPIVWERIGQGGGGIGHAH